MTQDILYGDYETRSTCDLKAHGADIYARHPTTSVMAFGYAFNDGPVEVLRFGEKPNELICNHIKAGGLFVAHNAPFEFLIWNYVWRRIFPDLPPLKASQLVCTMARCYAMSLPGSLEKASAALGIDQKKDLKGARVMLQLAQPREIKDDGTIVWWDFFEFEDKYETMYSYCGQDVVVQREIYKRTLALNDQEREMWELDLKINQRGVCVDIVSANAAVQIVELEQERLHDAMRTITDNAVSTTNAHQQLTKYLKNQGVKCEGVDKSSVADLLARDDLTAWVRRALEIRQEAAKSSTAKFATLIDKTGSDGRTRSTTQYHGASTGRWAGRGFQLHNLPRPKLKQDLIDEVFKILGG